MPYVYQAGVFTSYAINLGLADKQFQDELRFVAGTYAKRYIKLFIRQIRTRFVGYS